MEMEEEVFCDQMNSRNRWNWLGESSDGGVGVFIQVNMQWLLVSCDTQRTKPQLPLCRCCYCVSSFYRLKTLVKNES